MAKQAFQTNKTYQRCVQCVMDTTDAAITFDEQGVCDWCNDYQNHIKPHWEKSLEDKDALKKLAARIKEDGKGKKYDCLIGMSGGVDSSYLCYVVKEIMGLNPLVYVVDTGWNLDIANENIRRVVEALNLDLYTEVVDREEMKDLQLAFFKSQVPYQDLPQDHVIFAGMYNFAVKHKIKYVLTGANNATECIRPPMEWVYINDLKFIRSIHKKFGTKKLKTLPQCGLMKYRFWYPFLKGLTRVMPLNYVEYDKEKVKAFLQERFGWQPYDNKHYENIFTRFYEGYYLPKKFGFDKRKCYFSNLILTGGMTREEALATLEKEPYPNQLVQEDKAYIAKALGLSLEEFEALIDGENKSYKDYKNSFWFIQLCGKILRLLGKEQKLFR